MASLIIYHYPTREQTLKMFPTNREAFQQFAALCEDLELEWHERDNGDLYAGGLGSKFLIDLTQNP